MKFFLFQWPDDKAEYIGEIEKLQEDGHEISYWVNNDGDLRVLKSKFPKTIFHNHFKALDGLSAESIDADSFSFPEKELADRLCKVESCILTMMNKRFDWMCLSERRHHYYHLLTYWHGILTNYRPDVLVFLAPPHSVYDYLAYELARLMDVKTIIFDHVLIADRYFLMRDFREGSRSLIKALSEFRHKDIGIDELPEDLRDYYKLHINAEVDSTPDYVKEEKKKYSKSKVALLKSKIAYHSLQNGTALKKIPFFLFKFFRRNIKKEYRQVQITPDLDQKFVYIPLNYQPECTTSPQGDIFVDQILMIEIVSKSLPEEWRIYVKEHPSQWFPKGINFSSSRYVGYYRKISKIPRVSVIPVEANNYDLIAKSQAVATVSGTAAWESLLRGKPAVIFGYPWYKDFPGLLRADSVESCKKALNQIDSGLAIIKPKDAILFLKALSKATTQGYFGIYAEQRSKLSRQESARNLLQALMQEINYN